jgi:hypothetical membrane protein
VYPGYSHLVNAISELTRPGAPHKALLDGMFSIYNVLILGFGVILFIYPMPVKKTTIKIAGILLALIGLAGGSKGWRAATLSNLQSLEIHTN